MDVITLSALSARRALLPGGRCREQRPLLLVPVPSSPASRTSSPSPASSPTSLRSAGQSEFKDELRCALQYLMSVLSDRTRSGGLTVIIDASRGPWRTARACIRQVTQTLCSDELARLIVLRPDAFWDKQRVEHCTRTSNDGQAIYIPRSRLSKFVDNSQLPEEIGGRYIYNHNKWIENRLKVEEFVRDANEALSDLEQLRRHLLDNRAIRASDIERALSTSSDMNDSTRMLVHSVVETGKELLHNIEYENRTRKFDSEYEAMSTSQDTLDTIEIMENLLNDIQKKKLLIDDAWSKMEKSFVSAKDLSILEDGIARVVNWILGPAEMLLNSQQRVGYDVISSEELRREHEALELQCWNTYGHYAELLHKIDSSPTSDLTPQQKDLISQRDFMDFVCRSFATRLERRRNVLITSLRFFRLVSEYFDRTSEVFESLVMGNKVEDFSMAGIKLRELQENQISLDAVERELVKEGEKLSDMLSMPVKDALGREVAVNYSEDIVNIRDILDATSSRKNIFSDSVELQKLTLEQVAHISAYEKDVEQAVDWIDELFNVMIREHGHVGCNVYEIQAQKEEHQAFQETAKGTYNYGCQLLTASLSLRQSCKLSTADHSALSLRLRTAWQRLQTVSQEQMTRLRVCAVFHRSVDEHCAQLQALREAVDAEPDAREDPHRKRQRVKKFMQHREKLLVEVGRMMRLGRLLRSRLREPLYVSETMSNSDVPHITSPAPLTPSSTSPYTSLSTNISSPSPAINPDTSSDDESINAGNATAVEAISERLAEVTVLAERLDMALRGAQEDCTLGGGEKETQKSGNEEAKSKEDDGEDDFVTASECTNPQSRSSSFNTNSEPGHHSPWWEFEKDPNEDVSKEKMVLAVGCPDLPNPKNVLKPSPEVPPGKIVHEVTETTHLKVQHCHTLGVSSFVLTSETVRDGKLDEDRRKEIKEAVLADDRREVMIPITVEKDVDEDEFMKRMKEVGPPFEDKTAWSKYYHNYVTKQSIKGCL